LLEAKLKQSLTSKVRNRECYLISNTNLAYLLKLVVNAEKLLERFYEVENRIFKTANDTILSNTGCSVRDQC